MTPMEGRGLFRGAVLLVALSVFRILWSGPGELPPLRDGYPDALPTLAGESDSLRESEARRARPLGVDERLDPNRAGEEELDRLPGVGPQVAAAIVRHRTEHEGFRTAEDILRVSGIGPATLARISPHLDFSRGVPVNLRGPTGTTGRLDVNQASFEELQTLPGIGPALARRIIESRTELGGFRTPEELLRVSGIGRATLSRLSPLIRVER